MKKWVSIWVCMTGLLSAAAAVVNAQSAAPADLPGEEVMHPTSRGLTWTPGFSRAFSRVWIRENLSSDMELKPEQEQALSQNIADRVRQMSRDNPQVTQQFFETLVETMIDTKGGSRMTPAAAQKIGQAAGPIIPLWHDFLSQTADNAKGILDPEQQKQFEAIVNRRQRRVDRIGETVQRWSQGDYKKDDKPVDRLFDPGRDEDEQQEAEPRNARIKPEFRQAAQHARRMAGYEIGRLGTGDWQRFVSLANSTFKFTGDQSAKANALLADYMARAKAIMTPEWKQKVRYNRMQSNVGLFMQDVPSGPWLFHVNQEYDQLAAPIMVMQKELYAKVLALATSEQRDAVVSDLAAKAARHGLTMDDADRAVLVAALK